VSNDHFKLVVVGGGAGGATIVNKFTPKLGRVAVIDAAQVCPV
jgi:NADH dehydrogenase FAD-containing subunit